MSVTLTDFIQARGEMTLYGVVLSDLTAEGNLGFVGQKAGDLRFVAIRAFSLGEHCTKLPVPLILTVFGDGQKPEAGDTCAINGERVWKLGHKDEVFELNLQKGSALDLLEAAAVRGVSGGLAIRDLQYSNGTINGRIELWYEICVFGACAKDRKNIGFSIPVQGCHTILDFGVGSVKACVRNVTGSSAEVCVELCVGKWGLSKCWDECARVSFLTETKAVCGCKE